MGNILLAVSLVGLLVALGGLYFSTRGYRVASKEYDTLAEAHVKAAPEGKSVIDFAALRSINQRYLGWLEIPGTPLSYPAVHSANNSDYLNHTFEGTYNPSGAIFLDANANPNMEGTNSIFYGHNMKDKSMFATVQNYNTMPNYRSEHPEIYLYTENATYVYEVFALRQTTIEDKAYHHSFAGEAEQNAFLRAMDPGGVLQEGDRIITLSTCVNDGDPNTPHRYIVQAVLREERPAMEGIPTPDAAQSQSYSI